MRWPLTYLATTLDVIEHNLLSMCHCHAIFHFSVCHFKRRRLSSSDCLSQCCSTATRIRMKTTHLEANHYGAQT